MTTPMQQIDDDAATPTRVQWGVRYHGGFVRTLNERTARLWAADADPDGQPVALVQRTVSAWQEVQP